MERSSPTKNNNRKRKREDGNGEKDGLHCGKPKKHPRKQTELRRKLASLKPPTQMNDVYVSRKTHLEASFKRATKLLDDERVEKITVHGLGASLEKAVMLALKIQQIRGASVKLSTSTSSVELLDEVEGVGGSVDDYRIDRRLNSAIHIVITKTSKFES